MSFDPHTIEHLGIKMYSNIPNAIAELIANAYDADATLVNINLLDIEGHKSIEVSDNGTGMDFDEINEKFLRIGRKRRVEGTTSEGGRKVTGKKGLGKLAFFGIGDKITVTTTKKGVSEEVEFQLDWNELINTEKKDYEPSFVPKNVDTQSHGTTIRLESLKRKTPFLQDELAVSLSKLFNLFDSNFVVEVSVNNAPPTIVDNKLRFSSIESQFQFDFPGFLSKVSAEYEYSEKIKGRVYSTEKPLKPGLRGITLFANGRLVNRPEFFGVSESSHGFSYFTGWLDVDFVDEWDEDVISTDRQSLNWDINKVALLKDFLRSTMSRLEREWRERRKEERRKNMGSNVQLDLAAWLKTLPSEISNQVEPLLRIIEDSEVKSADQDKFITALHSIVPEYPNYHWRHLEEHIRDACYEYYTRGDYYGAYSEAVKRYLKQVRLKSGIEDSSERSLVSKAFGENGTLLTTKKYSKEKNRMNFNFTKSTFDSIEEGQKFLSIGSVTGYRNTIAHEEKKSLSESGLFSEKDCLDALSLLSHLFRRLEDSEKDE